MKKYLLVVGLMAAVLSPLSAYSAIIAYGSVTDPSGDSTNTSPDMVSGSVSIDSAGSAIFSVTYAADTSLDDASATFNLDIDKNPATGYPGVDTLNNNSALMGIEYIVRLFGSAFSMTGDLYGYSGGFWSLLVSGLPASYSGTTQEITIALSALGGIDGSMNFDVISQQQQTMSTFTGIGDYMPNLGAFGTVTVGAVTVPEPGILALLGIGLLGFLPCRSRQ